MLVEGEDERLPEQGAGPTGRLKDALGVGKHAGERLLAQHGLAGVKRADRPLGVQGVRQRDVQRADVLVVDERLVALHGALDAMLTRVLLGPGQFPACDYRRGAAGRLQRGQELSACDVRRAHDPPAHGVAPAGRAARAARAAFAPRAGHGRSPASGRLTQRRS